MRNIFALTFPPLFFVPEPDFFSRPHPVLLVPVIPLVVDPCIVRPPRIVFATFRDFVGLTLALPLPVFVETGRGFRTVTTSGWY